MEVKKIVKTIGKGLAGLGLAGLALYAYLKEPEKYSRDWINKLSPEEWQKERDIVQDDLMNAGGDIEKSERARRRLARFDRIKREQEDDGSEYVYPHYSEHGGNLYKED